MSEDFVQMYLYRKLEKCSFCSLSLRLSASVDVPYRPSLDYGKIKNDLLTLPERKKAFLLQALRWVWHTLTVLNITLNRQSFMELNCLAL